jgi:hypothetical protein
VALIVVVNIVSRRSSHECGLSHRVVALGSVGRPCHFQTVVDLDIQHSDLVLDG